MRAIRALAALETASCCLDSEEDLCIFNGTLFSSARFALNRTIMLPGQWISQYR